MKIKRSLTNLSLLFAVVMAPSHSLWAEGPLTEQSLITAQPATPEKRNALDSKPKPQFSPAGPGLNLAPERVPAQSTQQPIQSVSEPKTSPPEPQATDKATSPSQASTSAFASLSTSASTSPSQTSASSSPSQTQPQTSASPAASTSNASGIPNQPLPLISESALKFYGFVKASVIVTDKALESYSQQTLAAPTAAGNPEVAQHPNWASSSFQVAQSRFGVKTVGDSYFNGLFEFDIIDFGKSTPTVAAVIRVRRALVTHTADEWTYIIGQDWDLVSPLAPTTFNLVGHYFQSGDLGFMRLQVQALKKAGQFEHALALGFPNNTNGNIANNYEYSLYPTFAIRETFNTTTTKVGASAMIGNVKLSGALAKKSIQPYVVTLFARHELNGIEINAEAYYGRSLVNLNLQGLSYSTTDNQLEEAGGYVTLKKQLNPKHETFAGIGYSKVLSNRVLANPWNGTTSTPGGPITGGSPSGLGPGLKENSTYRIGYVYKPTKTVQLFAEVGEFVSIRQLSSTSTLNPRRTAAFCEVGIKADF